jgi:hypothetical protein
MTITNARPCFLFQFQTPHKFEQKLNGTWHLGPCSLQQQGEPTMGRYLLLWLLGIPIPILVLIWIFGGLH